MTLVVFDAGHGKGTPGKRSPTGEREWYFNDKVVRAAIARMKEYGVSVKRTDDPTGNTDVALGTRVSRANSWGATVFVSCHHNAMGGGWHNGGGSETYYYSGNSPTSKAAQLAAIVNPRVAKAMGLKDRGVKKGNFQVIRETRMPAILVEGGFMDSNVDIKALRDDAKLKAQGIAIADGVAQYLGLKVKGSETPVKPSIYVLYGELLKFGDTGSNVGKMQDDLTTLGFKTTRDNSFGPATEKQVKAFQKANKLTADGLVGPGTQTKMLTLLNAKKAEKPKPKPSAKTLHRVIVDGKQVGAYVNADNVFDAARKAYDKGAKKITIEEAK